MARIPCGNTEGIVEGKISPCLKLAQKVCNGCFLIQYCSKECQLSHWTLHKKDCKSALMKATWKPSWEVESRSPAFITAGGPPVSQTKYGKQKYLWGNVPALDVVKYVQNEGDNLPEDLHLLFAASGDIRNVVKSVVGLPTSYAGRCEIVINDRDFDIVARNSLLLLIALHFGPEEAAPIMLHIWYSALIPQEVLRSIQEKVLPLIQEVCLKIREKPADSLLSKTWSYGSRSLRLVLQKAMWDLLPSYLQVLDGLSTAQAQNVRKSTTLTPERRDYVDRALYTKPPPWRVYFMKFRKDGILLPFGSSRREFDVPNPTFYQTEEFWRMMDSADPREGWSAKELNQKAPLAKNDIYGSLFIYLQDILLEFCRRVEALNISFQLFQVDAVMLPGIVKERNIGESYFDRIEVSNIGDRGYLGPKSTLSLFGPLLKNRSQNRHATLLALFLNAVYEVSSPVDYIDSMKSETNRLRQYLPLNPAMLQNRGIGASNSADFLRFNDARLMLRDFDMLFQRFIDESRLDELSKSAGLEMKPKNTIVERWPLRLKKNATQQEFQASLASSHIGSERYVEWKRMT